MSAPTVTVAQLRPVVERALAKRRHDEPACVLVSAEPTAAPTLDAVDGEPVRVVGSRSPLEIRAALHAHAAHGDGVLVVLTDLDVGSLGDDLLARVVNRRPFNVDVWLTVCQLFGAERPSVSLAARPHLADELIEHRPVDGYPKVVSKVLDVDTAVEALLRTRLGLTTGATAAELLELAGTPEAASLFRSASPTLVKDLTDGLVERFGPLARAVTAVVVAGRGADVVPVGLAAGAIHHPDAGRADAARALLDRDLGRPGLSGEAWRAFAAAAEDLYRGSYDDEARARWRYAAGALLDDLEASGCARWSDVIPAGFDQRLSDVVEALDGWRNSPDAVDAADRVHQTINALKQHLDRLDRGDQITTCEMAARIIRRRSTELDTGLGLVDLADSYRADGSWLDLARVAVSRSSSQSGLRELCRALTDEGDRTRRDQASALAATLAKAALPLPVELTGVEDVLDRTVAAVGTDRPVLLVVLDGMGMPTFHEFAAELTAANWTPVTPDGHRHLPAVAVLPTVTEVSRTSLLAGTVRTGDGESEKRAFAAHPALLQGSSAHKPPQLFHKRDLRVGGLDTLPADTLDAIADTSRRFVGVVINNIDERLKDVVAPAEGWTLAGLSPLRDLLAEARRAGRAVVVTADHGHVLDRDAEQRGGGGGGGERWRPASGNDAATDEIVVSGPRVGAGDGSVVLPVVEQVRYSTRRNGYHGGLTPQEVFVPLVVLVTEDLDGWQPVSLGPPAWWHHHARNTAPAAAPARRREPSPPPTTTPTLFDTVEPESATTETGIPPLIAGLIDSERFAEQLANPRVRINVDQITPVLVRLSEGTPVPEQELSTATGLATARIGRFVTQLQELLNVEGYPVLRADAGEVRLDIAMLERQFDL